MTFENLTEFTTKDVTHLISKEIFHLPSILKQWEGVWKKSHPHLGELTPLTLEMESSDQDSKVGKACPFLKGKMILFRNKNRTTKLKLMSEINIKVGYS